MQMEIAMNPRRQPRPRCYQHHRHSRHCQKRRQHLLHYLRFLHACFVATYYRCPRHRLRRLHHHHRRLRRHRPCPHYQVFVIIHLKESTESGKASVQPRKGFQ